MRLIPIVLCFDHRILTGAGVTILSMLDSAAETTSYQFHVFTPGLPNDVQVGLQSLVAGSRHHITFHVIDPERFAGLPKNSGSWTEIVYYRLLASEILPGLDRVIYSDVDVFVARDMASVFDTDMAGCEWAGVAAERNVPEAIGHQHFPENTKSRIFFSGFMVMDLGLMRRNDAVSRYFEGVKLYGHRLKFFDLDLLNICTPEIAPVSFDYCVLESIYEAQDITEAADWAFLQTIYSAEDLAMSRDNPAIIHFAGNRGKPWQRRAVPAYFLAVEKRLPKCLQRKTFRDFRKRWLSRKGRRHLASRTPSIYLRLIP
jgi:lipopolysaccharide biosynthesis glycosyltransferase